MSLMVDPELNWIFGIIAGSSWPQGDEDKLRALAKEWDDVAADLNRAGDGFGKLTLDVTGNVGGTVGRNFVRFGHQLDGFHGDLAQLATGQAELLRGQALNIENAKYSILIQIAYTAAEILWALADPFTEWLVPEFIAEGQLAVRSLMKRFFGRTAALVEAAAGEAIEEVIQDGLAQLIQIIQQNRHGFDWGSLGMSAGFGAGAGIFAHGVLHGLTKYDPKFAASWKGAATVEAVTELGIGVATIPFGGDPSELGWSVLNGGLSGAATHAAHSLHHKDGPAPKELEVPHAPTTVPGVDGDNHPSNFEPAPAYDGVKLPAYADPPPAYSPAPAGTGLPGFTPGNAPAHTEFTSPSTSDTVSTLSTPDTDAATLLSTPSTATPGPTDGGNASSSTNTTASDPGPTTKTTPTTTTPATTINSTATATTEPTSTPSNPTSGTPGPAALTRGNPAAAVTGSPATSASPGSTTANPGSTQSGPSANAAGKPNQAAPSEPAAIRTSTESPSTAPKPATSTSTETAAPAGSGTPRHTELDRDADLTHRVNRELKRLGWQGGEVSAEDLTQLRAQRSDIRLATDVVGQSNQLAQIVITGDVVRLRGGADDRHTVRFDHKQKGQLSDEQRREITTIARAAASNLRNVLPHRRLVVTITGYGNGERSLLSPGQLAETATATGHQRATLVATEITRVLNQELGRHDAGPRRLNPAQDVRIDIRSAGRGGDHETDDTRRRADVTFGAEPHPDFRIPPPADLSQVDVPDRTAARGHDVNDPTLPMRAALDILAAQNPPDRTPRPQRPRLRIDQILWPNQHWMAYISPDDHVTAVRDHPDDPGSLYDHQHSPGFQQPMAAAVRTYLQGDGIDVGTLDWQRYSQLHTELSRGNFARSGQNRLAGFALRTPAPAADILNERIGDRPLMGSRREARQADQDGTPGPLTWHAFNTQQNRMGVTTRYAATDAPGLVDQIFTDFRADIAAATSDHDRLVAIARVIRNLHVLHLHLDGNGRLNVFLLLPRLLMEYGFVPPYLDHGNPTLRSIMNSLGALFNGGYTLDQIATALRLFQPSRNTGNQESQHYAGSPAPHPSTPDRGGPFGTPAGPDPDPRPRSSHKRTADESTVDSPDSGQHKRSRVEEILPGSAQEAVFTELDDARAHARPATDSGPWSFTRSGQDVPVVLSREGFAEHSLEPIRYLRTHHPDLLGLNSVRYHAAHPDYLANCVNVAVSVAETLGGRRTMPAPSGPRPGSLIEQHFGRPVVKLASPDGIATELAKAGPGAHAIVFEIRPDGTGHVFNAVHDPAANTIALIDAQSGRLASVRAGHDYRILITSDPPGSTSDTTLAGQTFGAPSGGHDSDSGEEDDPITHVNTITFPDNQGPGLTSDQVHTVQVTTQRLIRDAVRRLNDAQHRLVIVVRSGGPSRAAADSRARDVERAINQALAAYLPNAPYQAPRRLTTPEDIRIHVLDPEHHSETEVLIGEAFEPHPDQSGPDVPAWVTFHADPTIGLPARLDELATTFPPDLTPRPQPRPRVLLDQVLWHRERWLAYVDPQHHGEALRRHPDNPGSLYDNQRSPGFQEAMWNAVQNNLQGNGIDVATLDWNAYERLHGEVTAHVTGRFHATGQADGDRSGHALRTREPAPDTLAETIGGRPLLSPAGTAAATDALTAWHRDGHNTEWVVTRYRSTETPALVDEIFTNFRDDISLAHNDHLRLRAIARVVRDLHVLHPYVDGNGRLNVFLLLPRLLMEYGFTPMFRITDQARRADQEWVLRAMGALFSGGYTLDQIATAIRLFQP
jgi:fido (protein-threonine AMPylation protein)